MKLPKLPKLAEVRKVAVFVVGMVAQAVALGVVNGGPLHIAQVLIGLATGAGIYAAPNAKKAVPVVVPPAKP